VIKLEEEAVAAARARRIINRIRPSAITPKISPAIQIDLRANTASGGTTALWGDEAGEDAGELVGASNVVAAIPFVVEGREVSVGASVIGAVRWAVAKVCCELAGVPGSGLLFCPSSSVLCPLIAGVAART